MCLEYVRAAIQGFQQWKEEQESEASRGEEEEGREKEEGKEEESEEEVKRMGEIQREVLRLCIALLNQPLQDNEYKNVVISGLAVLGMQKDEG